MWLDKPIESITETDLQDLVTNEVAEGKTIEYKKSLPDDKDKSKKDFLADVSSFANAAGGHLFFGIAEEKGVPVNVCGLPEIDPDAQILRLEDLIRNSVQPRIHGVSMRAVRLASSQVVIVIQMPRSWAQPHVVKYGRHWRFYSRNSAGKYPLDVSEVRAAFALSQELGDHVRLFRSDRLGKIVARETPVLVGEKAKVVLHIVPFAAFDPSSRFDISSLGQQEIWKLSPWGRRGGHRRYNLDGVVIYEESVLDAGPSYVQLFRNGIIEAVDTEILCVGLREEGRRLPGKAYEKRLLETLPNYLSIQERLGAAPPLFIMLSLVGVLGYFIEVKSGLDPFGDYAFAIDRDALVLPEVVVESFEVDPKEVMRPIFDSVWNAAGWPRSMNYDDSGVWGKGPNC
jgi:hypothetical protein